MDLVIVESPAKGKTIEKYLGKDYKVFASFGHVRDLPKSKLGVDVKKDFQPDYVIPEKAEKVIATLKKELAKAENLYLATDYDREGEAIAFHLLHAIGINSKSKNQKPKVHRITFTEITEDAIKEAVKHPRNIDMNLVDAQQARRVLDRLVGYKLSPFLWRKVAQGLSAGRVQSVAVRLIVEKERENEKFDSQEYWTIEAVLSKEKKSFKAILSEKDGKKLTKLAISSEKEAQEITNDLENGQYKVIDLKTEEKKKFPSPPFTTSTLQQEAGSKLGYSAKQTMKLAQDLYENGLITYMRTDSVNVSQLALNAAQKVIAETYGKEYAVGSRQFKTKSKRAQEAHEAIRPSNPSIEADKVTISPKHAKLYDLIWKRLIASQMAEARVMENVVKVGVEKYAFTATGVKTVFDGFLKLYPSRDKEIELPELKIGDILTKEGLEKIQHFTEPPARYSEGTLIKELEKRGIGRPSTYAPTISTIQDRGYVEKIEGRFHPKDIGMAVNDILVAHFPKIADYNFTAQMEEELDEIAEGKLKWQPVIKEFYEPFKENLAAKMESVSKSELTEETEEICPKCGKKLLIKMGRYGKFLACSGFPECKFTQPLSKDGSKEPEITGKKCPNCGKSLVYKESRYGKFIGCEGYPECKYTEKIEIKSDIKCPNCGGDLVMKRTRKGRTFWGCSNYPKCKTAYWQKPTAENTKSKE